MAYSATIMPPLPKLKLGHFPSIVNRQLQEAYVAARKHSIDPMANGKLGMLLDAYKQYEEAEICYRRAHLLKPNSFRWIYYLGYVQFKQGQYQKAEKVLRAAINLKPAYLPAKLMLAECIFQLGDLEESENLYKRIVEQSPESATAYYGLGRAQSARGNLPKALSSLKKACELSPEYGPAQYALALTYRKLSDQRQAAVHFKIYKANMGTIPPPNDPLRTAIKRLDQGPVADMHRGLVLADTGNSAGAIAEQLRALAIDPKLVQAHINLMQLYGGLDNYSKAEEEYTAAVKLNPNRADCYFNYGVLEFAQRKYLKAAEAFRHALQINPYYAGAHNNLGYVFAMQGHLNEALKEFNEAVEDRPDFRMARFHIGQIYVEQGKTAEAIREFRKILNPDDASTPSYLYALGATYARVGDRQNALRYLREASDEASVRGQTQLLAHIKHDLARLEQ
jgi:tetratricopeptide (TPR) repeat protein